MNQTRTRKLPKSPRQSRRAYSKSSTPRRNGAYFKFKWRWLFLILFMIPIGSYISWLDIRVREQFEGKRWALPARVYASPLELYIGLRLPQIALLEELEAIGYKKNEQLSEPGQYWRQGNEVSIITRSFKFWDTMDPSRLVQISFANDNVAAVQELLPNRRSLALIRLEPQLIGKIYPVHQEDRMLVKYEEVPSLLVKALVAMEDRTFFQHHGISFRGVIRASMENFKAGEVVQGGSTITQQLVKNFYLTPEKTIERKFNEAMMSLLLEWHYSKQQILEAYLNEVFLGQDGNHSIHGMGMASWFYFDRPLEELKLPELALLVSLIRGASYYNPRQHPDRAVTRRNRVLDLMVEQGMIKQNESEVAKLVPLGISEKTASSVFPYPAFVELVRRQLRQDYKEADLRSEGLQVFTTLNLVTQRQAEKSFVEGIRKLEKSNRQARKLQGAMVVTNTENGEVLAMVNGKDSRYAGFNRPLDAKRQIGSLIKVAVYLTALENSRRYNLTTILDDSPYQWRNRVSGEIWKPQNYDFRSHGNLPLIQALMNSYNLATVRLGMKLGLDKIKNTLHRLGIERDISSYPSLLLGSIELTPLEVTQMYQTIANSGFRIPLRAIREVLNHEGKPLQRYPLSIESQVDPAPVYLLHYAMQQVVRKGTGHAVGDRLPKDWVLAGKTGTTNDWRDSWFAGFCSELVTVTWIGRDDNKPIGLSGGNGAMVIWGDFLQAVQPKAISSTKPNRVEWRWVTLGNQQINLPFIIDHVSTLADRSWFQ